MKQAGGLQTRLAPGDNPGIIRKIDIFNAGGVVLPRPSTATLRLRQTASRSRHLARPLRRPATAFTENQ